jgi:hypothetical protein
MSNNQSEEIIMAHDAEWLEVQNYTKTKNPNFGQIAEFKNVKLAREPLFWPFLLVRIADKEKENLFGDGCEECFATISLIEYAKDFINEIDMLYAKAQISRNQDRLMMQQPQINDMDFLNNIGVKLNFNKLVEGEEEEEGTPG